MKVLIVYGLSEPKSFNHALFETAQRMLAETGAEVDVSDLHAVACDPVSTGSPQQAIV